jgi:hypothetical protein
MNNKVIKKISLVVLLGFIASFCVIPSIRAESITLDGIISETVWIEWFEDSEYPSFSVYYTFDELNVHLGIILDIESVDDANLRFAFRADTSDFLIKITEEGDFSFYPGDSSRISWWGSKRVGLPYGVEVVKGKTNGKTSYEIKILKEILGVYADVPDGFPLWVMSKASDIAISNYYPNNREDWWFYREDTDPPTFNAPEFPLGSISSIVVMGVALLLVSRKNQIINLNT